MYIKNILFSFFLTLSTTIMAAQNDSLPQLIYVGDPMCSWCYGFGPEMQKALDSLDNKVQFSVVMGGLRPYNTERIADMHDFLKEHWEHVHAASGQPFNFAILSDTTLIYDTEPACRAVVIARSMQPATAFAFFKDVQYAFYFKNKDIRQPEAYRSICAKHDINYDLFAEKFSDEKSRKLSEKDFERTAELGVRGFPTLLLQHSGKTHVITRGYEKAEKVVEAVEARLEK